MKTFPSVPKLWPNSLVVCIATGPSLRAEDVQACRGQHVIAVNDAYALAPWADVLYACDHRWWAEYKGVPSFTGLKYALTPTPFADVQTLKNTGVDGIERDPNGLRTGQNSGYQALNLAVHVGASRILLLGYDMGKAKHGRTHFFGEHPAKLRQTSPYASFIKHFEHARKPLRNLGVEVINCTRGGFLNCFQRADLATALQKAEAA